MKHSQSTLLLEQKREIYNIKLTFASPKKSLNASEVNIEEDFTADATNEKLPGYEDNAN